MPSESESGLSLDAARPERIAVLLIAHGSRRAEANEDLVELARLLRASRRYEWIEASYLELAEPTIPQGCQTCAEHGATCVLMLPYFLSAGRHVTADLERLRADSTVRHPQIDFRLCPPLSRHPLMLEIIWDRLAEGRAAK